MSTRLHASVLAGASALLVTAYGCGTTEASGDEAPSSDPSATDGGGDGAAAIDGALPEAASVRVSFPTDGFEVWTSTYVSVETRGSGIERVEVRVAGESTARCTMRPTERCFVDLGTLATGAKVKLEVRALGTGATELARSGVEVKKADPAADVCRPGAPGDTANTRLCVNALVAAGRAAGYAGVTYENRDGQHSMAYVDGLEGLNVVVTDDDPAVVGGPAANGIGNLPLHQDPNVILVGNASMAIVRPGGMSLPRYSATYAYPTWSSLYENGKIFWFPARLDYGKTDYYHYMAPYSLCSQGASGSERDELSKYLVTLGAFRGDTRAKLQTEHALSAALQMLWRVTRVGSDTAYMTQNAQLSAFNDADNELAMVRRAQRIEVSDLPPVAKLAVTADGFEPTERAFTTPESVARVWSGATNKPRTIEVSATETSDVGGRPLAYFWRVLRGDAGAVDIDAVSADASRVKLTFRHHPARTETIGTKSRSSGLLVVALFVHDGRFLSAPVFVTSYTSEVGRYAPDDNQVDD